MTLRPHSAPPALPGYLRVRPRPPVPSWYLRPRQTPPPPSPRRSWDTLVPTMTVCIGAMVRVHGAIALVSDLMVANNVLSKDLATLKHSAIVERGRWWCMYSGSPTEYAMLKEWFRLNVAEDPKTLDDATRVVERACDALTKRLIERQVTSSFGFTFDQFLDVGLATFGDSYFRDLSEECRKVKLQIELLVIGFDERNRSHIFTSELDPGTRTRVCTVHDPEGVYAIGVGAWSAMGALDAHDIMEGTELSHTIYRLCEAKFISEVAPGVGKVTKVDVFFSDDRPSLHLFLYEDDPIRTAWLAHPAAPPPDLAIQTIDSAIRKRIDQQRKANPEPTKPS
jgi:hypothetical protein